MRSKLTIPLVAGSLALTGFAGVGMASTASAVPSCTEHASSGPTLSYGSTGYSVRQLQCDLNYAQFGNPRKGLHTVTVDGGFGASTRTAVIIFQRAAGITADGVVGPQTWAKLGYWSTHCVG